MALFGHTGSQTSQLTQVSRMIRDIAGILPLRRLGRGEIRVFALWRAGARLRGRCVARAGGYRPRGLRRKSRRVSPSGPRSGDPLGKGRESRPCTDCPTGRVGAPPAVSDSTSCLAKTTGHPWPAPCGLFTVGRLACATGPEGDTRRLFRRLRWRGVEPTRNDRTQGRSWVGADSSANPQDGYGERGFALGRVGGQPLASSLQGFTRSLDVLRVRRRSRLLPKICVAPQRGPEGGTRRLLRR